MRRIMIAGNWKMNLIDDIEPLTGIEPIDNMDILICPPFTHIDKYSKSTEGTAVKVGAQNAYYEDSGAYTGEISYKFLRDFGVEYVILGHSERRHVFGETDEMVNMKVKKGLSEGFSLIVCIGEKESDRENNKHKMVVENQLKTALMGIENNFENIIIAYEPVWAIGTGKTATPLDAEDMHKFIREKIAEVAGREISANMQILYGGSVKKHNVKDLLRQDNIDGALIGGASLKYDHFISIIRNAEQINI
ncbi:MAG: triose-phosphate isomerase [bacterium]